MEKNMKTKILVLMGLLTLSAQAIDIANVRYIQVTNRRPIAVANVAKLTAYANQNNYYLSVRLREGMKISFAASYGVGGEAAQARGTVVQRDGRYYFRQDANPTMNLLLPPGLPHNASDRVSLWDL